MDYTAIGEKIKLIRKTNGNLNQAEFGKIIGVSQDTVSLWETGKSAPVVDYIIAMAQNFTYNGEPISADWLLGINNDRF